MAPNRILTTHDTTRIDDTRIGAVRPLMTPALLQERQPLGDTAAQFVEQHRREIADVLHGRSDRLLAIVGPCSIHDHAQAMEYARQLQEVVQQFSEELLIIMRVYLEKRRTAVGWKG